MNHYQPGSHSGNPNGMQHSGSGKATASMVLGFVSIITWLLPIIGLPTTIIGLVLGIKGLKSNRRGQAIAGIVLSSIFLGLTLLNSIMGVL